MRQLSVSSAVFALASVLLLSNGAAAEQGTVRLKNGGFVSGELVEVTPDHQVQVQMPDGTLKMIPWSEVESVDVKPRPSRTTPSEPEETSSEAAPPEGRAAQPATLGLPRRPVFVPRIGIMVTGSGDEDQTVTITPPGTSSTDSSSYDDSSVFHVGAELLIPLGTPTTRLGLGLLYNTSTKVKSGSEKISLGSDLIGDAIIEQVFPVSPTVGLTLRGQGGLTMLIAGGDLKDTLDKGKEQCAQNPQATCNFSSGPYLGWNIGGGGGVLFDAGSVRPRVDLLFEHYAVSGVDFSVSQGSSSRETKESVAGQRLILLLGIEL